MAGEHDPKLQNERELQPDPLMKEGRSSKAWVWTVGIAILAIVIVYFFAVGYNGNRTAENGNPPHATRFTTGASNTPPRTAEPAGRTGSHSPKEGDYHTVR